jgi:hypothetical protein
MTVSNNSSTASSQPRVLKGPHLGSSKRPLPARIKDGADLVLGSAERKHPTIEQAAADVGVKPAKLRDALLKRGWRGYSRPRKAKTNGKHAPWQLALRALAHEQGSLAIVDELVAMGCPEPVPNGGSNGAGTAPHIVIVGSRPRA